MKKKLAVGFGVLVVALIAWMGFASISSIKSKKGSEEIRESLVKVYQQLGVDPRESEKKMLLIYFNSECEHCQWEVRKIGENLDLFENTNLAFVSHESEDQAIEFLKQHELAQFYLNASADKVMATFSGGVPQLFIYERRELKKHFRGEVKIEAILEVLKD